MSTTTEKNETAAPQKNTNRVRIFLTKRMKSRTIRKRKRNDDSAGVTAAAVAGDDDDENDDDKLL